MTRLLKYLLPICLLPIAVQAQTITNLGVTAMSSTTATISWTTSIGASTQLLYGTSSLSQATPVDSTLLTSHTVTISGLTAGTTYIYAAVSGSTQSSTQKFTDCSSPGTAALSGTINNYYEYGLYTITWVNDSGQSVTPTLCGAALTQTFTGTLDNASSLSLSIPDNLQIVPSPSHWHIAVTGIDGSIGAMSTTFTTAGGALNISASLAAAAVNNLIHVWEDPTTGIFYPAVTASSVAWGHITGTLSNQTDLQNALNAKLNLSGGTMTGALTAPNITDSALTSGDCVQASTGGLLATTAFPCGSVASIGMTVPSALLAVTPSSITSSGTFAITLQSQSANLGFFSPNGSSGTPSFRASVEADLPSTTAFTDVSRTFTTAQTFSAGLSASSITDSGLTSGRCVVTTTGGLLTTTSGTCNSGTLATVGLAMPSQWSVSNSPLTGAGGTITVTLTSYTGTGAVVLQNNPLIDTALNVFTSAGGDQPTFANLYSPNSTTAGNSVGIEIGTTGVTNFDSAHFGFVYEGEGLPTNYASMGMYGAEHVLNIFGTTDVAIGTTLDNGYALTVTGDINTTGVYRVNGTQIAASNLSNVTTGSGSIVLASSASTTVNGQTCTLGSTCTITAAAAGITVGTTTVSSGTSGYVLYDNAGTLGNLATTGSGSVVLQTSPTINTSLAVSATGSSTTPILTISNPSAASTSLATFLDSNLSIGNFAQILIGHDSATSLNTAALSFHYAGGSGSSSNYKKLDFGTDGVFNIFGTGNVTIGGASDGGVKLFVIGNEAISGSGTAFRVSGSTTTSGSIATFLSPSLATSNFTAIQFGTALTTNNAMGLLYHFIGSGSTSNFLEFDFAGSSTSMSLFASGNISVGTTTDSGDKFYITGTAVSRGILHAATANTASNTVATFLSPSLATSNYNVINVGVDSLVTDNSASFGFHYVGSSSTANFASIGISGFSDNILNVFASGDVSIGSTTDGGYKLNVSGNIATNSSGSLLSNNDIKWNTFNASTTNQVCYGNSGTTGYQYQIATCSSLAKYKANVETLDSEITLNQLLKLRPINYRSKTTYREEVGFIAEEAVKVNPRIATYDNDGGLVGLDYGHITALLVSGFQRQQKEIEALQEEIKQLKNK